jgi:hypothetical protein
MLQITGSNMIGHVDMELSSVASPLHNNVMKDHTSWPPRAAGTHSYCDNHTLVGQRLISCNKE